MTDNPDPSAILVRMEHLLADLDRLGADIAAARLGLRLIQSQNANAVTSATPDRKLAASLS